MQKFTKYQNPGKSDHTESIKSVLKYSQSHKFFNVQKLPQMTFLGLLRCKQLFFTPKVNQVIQDSNEIFLRDKNYFF